jgi:RNA polymerase sigma-70 factor (ECF subfamily)
MTRRGYGQAYERGFGRTVRFLASKGAQCAVAEETAQAAWTRGWERINQLRDDDFVQTWINTIALNMYRKEAEFDSRKETLLESTGCADGHFAAIDLSNILECCGSAHRTLLLHQLHGLSTGEIAHQLGASETAVRLRLMRARRFARSLLGREAA